MAKCDRYFDRRIIDEIEELKAENERLKEYARHKDDCLANRLFYIRECPFCRSTKNAWQRGGPGFESYRSCEECGRSYIPKTRYGECTCGLVQALEGE